MLKNKMTKKDDADKKLFKKEKPSAQQSIAAQIKKDSEAKRFGKGIKK